MKRTLSLLLTAALALSLLAGCGPKNPPAGTSSSAPGSSSVQPDGSGDTFGDSSAASGPSVRFMALSGPTGVGAAKMMADVIVATGIPGILVPIIIGVIMRFPQGSGTTAMITGSAIVAPMVTTLGINPYLAALALCLTTMCPSFLNDSYFHVVTSFSGMDIKTSLKTWTIGSILVPAFGSVIFVILSLFIH